jgi:hypothetical protein
MHIAVQRGHFGPEATADVEMSASGNAPQRRELPVEEDAMGVCTETPMRIYRMIESAKLAR